MENLKTKIEKWKKNKGKKTNGKMVKVEKTVGLHDGVPFNLKVKLGRKHIQNAGGIKEREREGDLVRLVRRTDGGKGASYSRAICYVR